MKKKIIGLMLLIVLTPISVNFSPQQGDIVQANVASAGFADAIANAFESIANAFSDFFGGSGTSGGNASTGGTGGAGGDPAVSARGYASAEEAYAAGQAAGVNTGTSRGDFNGTTVGRTSDGSYGYTNSYGGGGSGDSTGYIYNGCSTASNQPDLIISEIFFVTPDTVFSTSTAYAVVALDNIANGGTFDPVMVVQNIGCRSTNYTDPTTGPVFTDSLPSGSNGTFPVRLRIDYGNDGTSYEVTRYVNEQGPLSTGEIIFVRFPSMTFTQNGTHGIEGYVDADTCGATGCITELREDNNSRTAEFLVAQPYVDLGSFYDGEHKGFIKCDTDEAYVPNWSAQRDIDPVVLKGTSNCDNAGIWAVMWKKFGILSCTSENIDSDGITHTDFDAESVNSGPDTAIPPAWRFNRYTGQTGADGYDITITEPTLGKWSDFTATCLGYDGNTYSDTHRLYYGNPADVPPSVKLEAALNGSGSYTSANRIGINKIFQSNEVQLQWSSTNADVCTVDIVETGAIIDNSSTARSNVDVSEPTIGNTFTYRAVCINTTTNVSATDLLAIEVGAANFAQQTLTAYPLIIRTGNDLTVGWDPKGNNGCTLSPNNLFTGVDPDAVTPSYVVTGITGETTLTYACPGNAPVTKTITVLPSLSET